MYRNHMRSHGHARSYPNWVRSRLKLWQGKRRNGTGGNRCGSGRAGQGKAVLPISPQVMKQEALPLGCGLNPVLDGIPGPLCLKCEKNYFISTYECVAHFTKCDGEGIGLLCLLGIAQDNRSYHSFLFLNWLMFVNIKCPISTKYYHQH